MKTTIAVVVAVAHIAGAMAASAPLLQHRKQLAETEEHLRGSTRTLGIVLSEDQAPPRGAAPFKDASSKQPRGVVISEDTTTPKEHPHRLLLSAGGAQAAGGRALGLVMSEDNKLTRSQGLILSEDAAAQRPRGFVLAEDAAAEHTLAAEHGGHRLLGLVLSEDVAERAHGVVMSEDGVAKTRAQGLILSEDGGGAGGGGESVGKRGPHT